MIFLQDLLTILYLNFVGIIWVSIEPKNLSSDYDICVNKFLNAFKSWNVLRNIGCGWPWYWPIQIFFSFILFQNLNKCYEECLKMEHNIRKWRGKSTLVEWCIGFNKWFSGEHMQTLKNKYTHWTTTIFECFLECLNTTSLNIVQNFKQAIQVKAAYGNHCFHFEYWF